VEHWLSGEHHFIMGDATARPTAGRQGRLFINTSNNTIESDNGSAWVSTGAVIVPGSIGSAQLGNNSVTNVKIAYGAVTGDKIQDGTITGTDIADGSISASKLAGGVISGGYLQDGAVSTSKIADGAVNSAKIADKSIGNWDIGDGQVIRQILGLNACNGGACVFRSSQWIYPTTPGCGLILEPANT
jgi:hypothetical protein